MNSPAQIVQALDSILYGDAFDCAVTFEEILRFSRLAVDREAVNDTLALPAVKKIVHGQDGLFYLHGNAHLVKPRLASLARASVLKRRAGRVARCVQYLPFVRGIVLTGSVAADDARPDADVDFLIIVARRRLSFVFLLLGAFSRLTGRRVFCPNYYLSEDHLEIRQQSHFTAREIAQARALAGCGITMLRQNGWVRKWLPNGGPREQPVGRLPGGRALQRLLEWPFRGGVGDRLERLLARLAIARLASHYGSPAQTVPPDVLKNFRNHVELRFHNAPKLRGLLARHEELSAATLKHLEQAWQKLPEHQGGSRA